MYTKSTAIPGEKNNELYYSKMHLWISSSDNGEVPSIGPNFPTNNNSRQNLNDNYVKTLATDTKQGGIGRDSTLG